MQYVRMKQTRQIRCSHVTILYCYFQLVGDFNALCTKDTDCQRFMQCSGMNDGTRRCQCQTKFIYDNERKRCRKSIKQMI
jgi:hypothetical protein